MRGLVAYTISLGFTLIVGYAAAKSKSAERVIIPYAAIPHFPVPTVAGHAGNLVAGTIEGAWVYYLQGRFHAYEGHELAAVTFPVRVLQRLGVEVLVLTAATGGINPTYQPGNLVLVTDHLNLSGQNPCEARTTTGSARGFPT